MFKFQRKYNGRAIVADFRRLLQTGEMGRLTPRLYQFLTLSGGFIAHYNIDGFREYYGPTREGLSGLLRGEFIPLYADEHHPALHSPALEDSGYKDGVSAGEVLRAVCAVGRELAPMVRQREINAARMAEIRHLRDRYGVVLEVATAMVNGSGGEVTLVR